MNESWGVLKRGSAAVKAESPIEDSKQGFTIIEVMLVLAVTGLMLVGVIAGTYSSIASQRYNDSVRSFSEFLRQVYAEVISPQSLGEGNSDDEAVYGKVIVFGINAGTDERTNAGTDDTIYTATLVGGTHPPRNESNFIEELGYVNTTDSSRSVAAHLFCGDGGTQASTLDGYIPMWEAKINNTDNKTLKGTLIIARSPSSGTVHTAFTDQVYDIKNNCQAASTALQRDLQTDPSSFNMVSDLDFCIVSDNSRIVRDIRLSADGHNSSAINLIPADGDVKCVQK